MSNAYNAKRRVLSRVRTEPAPADATASDELTDFKVRFGHDLLAAMKAQNLRRTGDDRYDWHRAYTLAVEAESRASKPARERPPEKSPEVRAQQLRDEVTDRRMRELLAEDHRMPRRADKWRGLV